MKSNPVNDRLREEVILRAHLAALTDVDPSLVPVLALCDPVPLRAEQGGFAGLSRIVIGQLLSVQSAAAIWGRFTDALGELNAKRFVQLDADALNGVGLSKAKSETIMAIAFAELSGDLDYDHVALASLSDALTVLTAIKGIGPWTAEVYLSFCVGHPDIFPAGDLALRKIVAHHMGHNVTPSIKRTIELTQKWSPYRGAAARLMWRYYAVTKSKEGILI